MALSCSQCYFIPSADQVAVLITDTGIEAGVLGSQAAQYLTTLVPDTSFADFRTVKLYLVLHRSFLLIEPFACSLGPVLL